MQESAHKIDELRCQLEASKMRVTGILETAVNAIITISDQGIIETVNAATERIFGYKREELIGRNVSMLMPTPYREAHDGYLAHYRSTGQKKIIGIGREAIGQRKDGSVFPLDLSVGEVNLASGRIFTGIIRDLTERKQLEEKLLAISEEEQVRIGQDIHDDLCQQLAAIGCLARVAYQRLSAQDRPEALQLAEITRLITNANVRAREMSRGLMPVVLDSGGLMAALADLASSTERIFRVSCPFRCDPPVSISNNKAATQLYRIGQEAVANAIKHSKADRIEISLALTGGLITLCISDNGCGLPDDQKGRSQGMGLLTMNHRARMIGGALVVEADRFGGTLVRCTVPEIMRHGLAQLICMETDLDVCGEAGNAADGVIAVAKLDPDLVIVDLTLPDKHGLELIKDILAQHPGTRCIVLSMHDESLYAERALKAGARGYLMKETAAENLINAIQRVLGGGIYVSDAMSSRLLEQATGQRGKVGTTGVEQLSDRELEVMELIGKGTPTKLIAEKLKISTRTVEAHRAHIKEKLGITDGSALVRYAVQWAESKR
jgi:two-component system, LuxR family, sensor kinase FixL